MRRVIRHGAMSLLVGLDEVTFQARVYKNGWGFRYVARDVIAPPQTTFGDSVCFWSKSESDPDHPRTHACCHPVDR
jgi:hypothetical protein